MTAAPRALGYPGHAILTLTLALTLTLPPPPRMLTCDHYSGSPTAGLILTAALVQGVPLAPQSEGVGDPPIVAT